MGANRSIYKNDSEAKIQLTIAEECGASFEDMYEVWKAYALKRLNNERNIVQQLREMEALSQAALDYFTTIGFELFAVEYLKEHMNGK
jgi:citrate synthase